MDPVTVIATITSAAGKALIGEAAKDAWKAAKAFFTRKAPAAAEAVEDLEARPSERRESLVRQELENSGLLHDPELLEIITRLAAALKSPPANGPTLITASGTGAIASGKIGTVVQGGVSGGLTINPGD